MADTIEYNLKEILTRLEGRFDKLETKIDKLDGKIDKVVEDLSDFKTKVAENFGALRSDLARVENSLKGEVKVLSEKIDGIAKRVDTQEFINRGVIIGLILAVLGGFAKVFRLTN